MIVFNILLAFAGLSQSSIINKPQCRYVPGDARWPSSETWKAFNETVGGKLVATVPLGAACHDSQFGPYNAEKCDDLRSNWYDPSIHIPSSSSPMSTFFANNTCNPFGSRNESCTIGNLVSYAVNATDDTDFQKAVAFVRKHNIRLVIRNTGHDYNGKSTGAGALAIWTHYMKKMELIDYNSTSYFGKAAKLGAGVQVEESYQFTYKHGLVNVGGDCPTVGVVGGYTQGGGHGPAVSRFGLGSDQALEWEVITGTGEKLTASREQNQDLFWALSGGGGGTFGVVSSLTVRVYPDLRSSASKISFPLKGINEDDFWDAVGVFQSSLIPITEAGCFAIFAAGLEGFELQKANCPGVPKAQTHELMLPLIHQLNRTNIPYNYSVDEFPTFYDSYKHYNIPSENISQTQYGSRLIPRDLIVNNGTELIDVFRKVVKQGAVYSGTAVNISRQGFETEHTSVDPARRNMVYSAVLQTVYNQTSYAEDIRLANDMSYKLLPMLEKLTPNGRAYLNEADFQQPNFQEVFYGVNYPRLLRIKDKYDPDQIFYAVIAVGSERWYEDRGHGGRLCPVPKGA